MDVRTLVNGRLQVLLCRSSSRALGIGLIAMVGVVGCAPALSSAPSTSIQAQQSPTATIQRTATATVGVLRTPATTATPIASSTAVVAKPTQAAKQQIDWETYSSQRLHVSLRYPNGWQPKQGSQERYEGADGFFQLDAAGGVGVTIDKLAEAEANHKLQPYGSKPTIEKLQIQGQEARLILPSDDQPKGMKGQAGLIVRSPKAISIGKDTYDFLILWADKGHIREIAQTLQFGT